MKKLLSDYFPIVILIVWFVLQFWILPKLGVST